MGAYISLKQNIDFRRLYRRGKSVVTPSLVVYAAKNREKINRLGITAGKKIGGAVQRNRAKRRIRALFYNWEKVTDFGDKTYDFVVVARARAVDSEAVKLKRDFQNAIEKAISQIN